jgi:hypothetical protein
MQFFLIYDDTGNYLRVVFDPAEVLPGEYVFDHQLTEEELIQNFPNYVPQAWVAVQQRARSALITSDGVFIRCGKANKPFPQDWWDYVEALRAIVRTRNGDVNLAMPTPPPYPPDT